MSTYLDPYTDAEYAAAKEARQAAWRAHFGTFPDPLVPVYVRNACECGRTFKNPTGHRRHRQAEVRKAEQAAIAALRA